MNNSTTMVRCAAIFTDSTEVKAIKTVLCSLIMTGALTGNLFVVFIVLKNKNMRRTTNIFIANMAVSDLLIAAIVIPRLLAELYLGPKLWLVDGFLGLLLCKMCFFFVNFCLGISITSHAVIAMDRFWAIVYSLRPSPITPDRRKYIIIIIWLYCLMVNSPNLYTYKLKFKGDKTYCVLDWSPLDQSKSQTILFTVIFIFIVCIPLLLILVLYSWLVVSLTRKTTLQSQTQEFRAKRRKEDITVLRKVAILVTVFLVSLIPITTMALLQYYYWDGQRIPCNAWGFAFAVYFLLLSNSAINPWLCILLHGSYRSHLRKTMRKMTFHSRARGPKQCDVRRGDVDGVQEENTQMLATRDCRSKELS